MQKHLFLILVAVGLITFSSANAADDDSPTADMSANKLSLFPILPYGAGPDALPQLIPISNNRMLAGPHPGMTRVIIGIHDSTRNAQGLVSVLSTIGGPTSKNVLILVPQFLAETDANIYYPDMPEALRKTLAFWPIGGWVDGGESEVEKPLRPISSFTVIDLLLMYLGEKTTFPDLKDIVIAGHGDGADFAQRYAVMGAATNYLEKEGIAVHFVVANAGSYLYVTTARPKTDSLGFATPTSGSCSMFNYYKYGTEYMNIYGKQIGENAMKTNYGERRVTYLLGENIAAADPAPEVGCGAMYEGPNRLARGANYYSYVYRLYGDTINKRQKAYIVPKTAYNVVTMLGSRCGASVLFGDGSACENPISPTVEIPK